MLKTPANNDIKILKNFSDVFKGLFICRLKPNIFSPVFSGKSLLFVNDSDSFVKFSQMTSNLKWFITAAEYS